MAERARRLSLVMQGQVEPSDDHVAVPSESSREHQIQVIVEGAMPETPGHNHGNEQDHPSRSRGFEAVDVSEQRSGYRMVLRAEHHQLDSRIPSSPLLFHRPRLYWWLWGRAAWPL